MDSASLKSYKRRWQAVAKIEAAENSKQTAPGRWRQLNTVVRLAASLKVSATPNSADSEAAWRRWNELRRLYLESHA